MSFLGQYLSTHTRFCSVTNTKRTLLRLVKSAGPVDPTCSVETPAVKSPSFTIFSSFQVNPYLVSAIHHFFLFFFKGHNSRMHCWAFQLHWGTDSQILIHILTGLQGMAPGNDREEDSRTKVFKLSVLAFLLDSAFILSLSLILSPTFFFLFSNCGHFCSL